MDIDPRLTTVQIIAHLPNSVSQPTKSKEEEIIIIITTDRQDPSIMLRRATVGVTYRGKCVIYPIIYNEKPTLVSRCNFNFVEALIGFLSLLDFRCIHRRQRCLSY